MQNDAAQEDYRTLANGRDLNWPGCGASERQAFVPCLAYLAASASHKKPPPRELRVNLPSNLASTALLNKSLSLDMTRS